MRFARVYLRQSASLAVEYVDGWLFAPDELFKAQTSAHSFLAVYREESGETVLAWVSLDNIALVEFPPQA